MRSQETIDIILNKKFKKTVFSGYETIDVDTFFDEVIEYIKALEKSVDEYKKLADEVKLEVEKSAQENANLRSENQSLIAQIKKYEANGYGNVITNNRLKELEDQVKELKGIKGE